MYINKREKKKGIKKTAIIILITILNITSCGLVSEYDYHTDKQPCAVCQTMVTREESHWSEYESMRLCNDCCVYSEYMEDYICNDCAVYIPERNGYVHKDLATTCPNCGESIIKENKEL